MWGKVKKTGRYLLYFILLFMGIGQMPSLVGRIFLVMALLVFPGKWVGKFVDEMLAVWSRRWMCLLALTVYLACLPVAEIEQAGRNLGRFLSGIARWLGLLA